MNGTTRASTSVSQNTLTIPTGTRQTLAICFVPDTIGRSTLQLHLERGSQLDLFESLSSDVADWSHACHITLDDEASLTWTSLQTASPATTMRHQQKITLGNGASLTLKNFTLGGKVVEHTVVSALTGTDATSTIEWAAFARGNENMKLSATNTFLNQCGGGEIVMRAVAEEKAHIVCDGKIEIGKQGIGTNTYLTQNVLMLDASAKVDAIPRLEIKTNDVKASHSASVARVTPEDLFYFAARGIPAREARQLFVSGFLGALAETIENEDRREEVLGSLLRKMKDDATS